MSLTSRRAFLQSAGLAVAGAALPASRFGSIRIRQSADPWTMADTILRRISAPRFPDREFDITRFGAVAGGSADATSAIRDAIAACERAGGGRVLVPAGRFLTGAIHLKNGVNLHLHDDATLLFSRDPNAYLPVVFTRFEGVELMNFSPFVYAFEAENIAVTGRGTLDGQADAEHWWPWPRIQGPDRTRLIDLAAKGVPVAERVFGDGHVLRPNFIQPYRSRNVLIEGVTIVNSPMWEIHPCLCTNVIVRDVTISSHGPNNDGCDPESCTDVLIERCSFDTGDDCIAIKSGRNDDGRRVNVPVQNVIVRDCQMKDGHGGVTIGSEISGGARQIFAEHCRMDSPRLDRVLRFKNNAARGGLVERVAMRDVTVGEVAEAIVAADFFYEEGRNGKFTPILRDVDVRNVTSRKSKYAFLLRGFAESPIANVRVSDCRFDGVADGDVLEGVKDLTLANVTVNGRRRDERISR